MSQCHSNHIERGPCPGANDAIRDKSVVRLELSDRSFGLAVEIAARVDTDFSLDLFN